MITRVERIFVDVYDALATTSHWVALDPSAGGIRCFITLGFVFAVTTLAMRRVNRRTK
jgi:hypothetical protein